MMHGHTYINSTLLDPLLRRNGSRGENFTIGSFEFSLREEDDYRKYVITRNDVSFPFQILTIHTSKECGAYSNRNLVEFIWDYLALLWCRMYAIVAINFGTPRILCMKHHWTESGGWMTHSLCDMWCNKYKGKLSASIDDFNFSVSCKYKLCLLQPPSLRGLASHTVFHFIYYVKQFKLTSDIIYDHYVYAAFSQTAVRSITNRLNYGVIFMVHS